MPLETRLNVSVVADHTAAALDFAIPAAPLQKVFSKLLTSGTGADQADRIWHDQRTLTASSTENLDLAGVLTDSFGATVTFARVKLLWIYAAAGNTNNVIVGGEATNGWATWVGAAAHTVTIRPGGLMFLAAPDATAYAVTAGTGDLLKIANSGGGSSVTYDVIVIGASA